MEATDLQTTHPAMASTSEAGRRVLSWELPLSGLIQNSPRIRSPLCWLGNQAVGE